MDYRFAAGVLGVICLILAGFIVFGGTVHTEVVEFNNTVYPVEDLTVYYLYPLRCVDCDLHVQGECDYCTSYYDIRLMDLISQEVGTPVQFKVSDAVSKPAVMVMYEDKATLGDARTRYNIAHTICLLSGLEKSCQLFESELERVGSCVEGYGLGEDSIVYHTSSGNCPICESTDKVVDELEGLEYDDGVVYDVYTADHAVNKEILTDCLQAFDRTEYAPQLLCPATGKDLTGDFTLSEAREFADKCIEA
ncbi:MAG: hypothetical protein GF414_03270 [Candidatus Altiarchaeales archaeon]|nr:hypothetical protein [Candidatus Altiarchaeales archaeon]